MTKRFVVTKDEITQTITYKEYDNLKLNRINYINQTLIIFKMKQ